MVVLFLLLAVATALYIFKKMADPGPEPIFRALQARPAIVEGCFSCILASTAGDDVLIRHKLQAH